MVTPNDPPEVQEDLSVRISSMTNRAAIKRFILDSARNHRSMADGTPRFTRVSGDTLNDIEAQVAHFIRTTVESKVHSLPSAGRTV